MKQAKHRFGRQTAWIALLAAASLGFSLSFACAMPFAAIAGLTAACMNRRDAFLLTGLSWLTNQAVGYGILHYPTTWDSFAWGTMIGIAALAATQAAFSTQSLLRRAHAALAAGAAFMAAFVAYEFLLYAATAFLPSGDEAFSMAVVLQILGINALAWAGLMALQKAGERSGLAQPRAA